MQGFRGWGLFVATCAVLTAGGLGACEPTQERAQEGPRAAVALVDTSGLSPIDPCAARNPSFLVETEVVRDHRKPGPVQLPFALPVPVDVCVDVRPVPSRGHWPTAGVVSLDRDVLLAPEDFLQRGQERRFALHLPAGEHALQVELRSKPGTRVMVAVSVAGPVIDSFTPIHAAPGETLTFRGEGLYAPLQVSSGEAVLANALAASSGRTAQATIVPGMAIGPIKVTTPFGSAETPGAFVPTEPRGVVQLYPRIAMPDARGDGTPDIESVMVMDDGDNAAILVRTFEPLQGSVEATAIVRGPFPGDAERTWTLSSDGVEGAVGLRAAAEGNSVAFVLPKSELGTDDLEGFGRFFLKVILRVDGTSDTWPDSGQQQDIRPMVAPRYLRYRAVDPQAVALRHGAEHVVTSEGSDMSLLRLPPGANLEVALKELIEDPDAVGVFPEPLLYATYSPTDGQGAPARDCTAGAPHFDTGTDTRGQWALQAVHAREAWSNAEAGFPKGKGVKVIVADSGVADHAEFPPGRIDRDSGRNLLLPGTTSGGTGDGWFHGTAVTGTIVAQGDNGGISGIAPEATVVPFKIIYRTGITTGFGAVSALEAAMRAQERDPSIKVINLSLAEPIGVINMGLGVIATLGSHNPLWSIAALGSLYWEQSVAREAARKLLVVASSGNSRNEWFAFYGSAYPANVEGVLSVGALAPPATPGAMPRATAFTTQDATVGIAAPGEWVMSSWKEEPTALGCFAGTSFSSPLTAGAAAVLYSIPGLEDLSPQQMRHVLQSTATPTGDAPDLVGAGMLNLEFAVKQAMRLGTVYSVSFGRIHQGSVLDTAFAENTHYFLLSPGDAIARDEAGDGRFLSLPHGAGTLDWIAAGPRSGTGVDVLYGGHTGASTLSRLEVSGDTVSSLSLTLPGPVVAKPAVALGPDSPAGQVQHLLVPVTQGLVSVDIQDATATPTLILSVPDVRAVAVSRASLRKGLKRLVLEVRPEGGPSRLWFYTYDPVTQALAFEQPSDPLPFDPCSLAVANAPFGSARSTSSRAELPVYASCSPDGVLLAAFDPASSRVQVERLPDLTESNQVLAAPWRPEMYVISEEGILFGLDAPTGKRTLRYDFPRQFPYACSLSDDGETMACADMLHLFNANDPSKYYERGLLIHNL